MSKKSKRPKTEKKLIKLDIACGQNKTLGHIGIDIVKSEGVDIVHDLMKFPWPIESETVESAWCSHYIEHIPMEICDPRVEALIRILMTLPNLTHKQKAEMETLLVPPSEAMFSFMDEVYRVMAPNGQITFISPYYSSMRAWQDPTHRRAICEMSYLYFNKNWRVQNKLDHYPVKCDFDFAYFYHMNQNWAGRSEETRNFAIVQYINVVSDLQVTLTKKPMTNGTGIPI